MILPLKTKLSDLTRLRAAGPVLRSALDIILPPRCIGTGEIVEAQGLISPEFWSKLSFISAPLCDACGIPFPFETPENFKMSSGTLCAACLERRPAFERARAAVIYNDASRKLVVGFKYGDKPHYARTFAPWLARAGAELLEEAEILVPVPLHRRRLWQRRFNQSAVLAQALASLSGKACLPDALERQRHTPPQQGLSRKHRNDNVKNAFQVPKRCRAAVEGRNILLIDDVYTSGATLDECARTLKKARAASVNVLTIARVSREET
jgi:ComF family protein